MNPFDHDDRALLRAQLQARLEVLRNRVAGEIVPEADQTFSGMAGEVRDAGDISVAQEQSDLRSTFVERDATALTAVDRALARLEDGSYGVCVDCGLEIDAARLTVLPEAERCNHCQELAERRPARFAAAR